MNFFNGFFDFLCHHLSKDVRIQKLQCIMVNPISGKVWNDVIRQAWVNLNRKYFKQDKYPWVIQNGPKSQN